MEKCKAIKWAVFSAVVFIAFGSSAQAQSEGWEGEAHFVAQQLNSARFQGRQALQSLLLHNFQFFEDEGLWERAKEMSKALRVSQLDKAFQWENPTDWTVNLVENSDLLRDALIYRAAYEGGTAEKYVLYRMPQRALVAIDEMIAEIDEQLWDVVEIRTENLENLKQRIIEKDEAQKELLQTETGLRQKDAAAYWEFVKAVVKHERTYGLSTSPDFLDPAFIRRLRSWEAIRNWQAFGSHYNKVPEQFQNLAKLLQQDEWQPGIEVSPYEPASIEFEILWDDGDPSPQNLANLLSRRPIHQLLRTQAAWINFRGKKYRALVTPSGVQWVPDDPAFDAANNETLAELQKIVDQDKKAYVRVQIVISPKDSLVLALDQQDFHFDGAVLTEWTLPDILQFYVRGEPEETFKAERVVGLSDPQPFQRQDLVIASKSLQAMTAEYPWPTLLGLEKQLSVLERILESQRKSKNVLDILSRPYAIPVLKRQIAKTEKQIDELLAPLARAIDETFLPSEENAEGILSLDTPAKMTFINSVLQISRLDAQLSDLPKRFHKRLAQKSSTYLGDVIYRLMMKQQNTHLALEDLDFEKAEARLKNLLPKSGGELDGASEPDQKSAQALLINFAALANACRGAR